MGIFEDKMSRLVYFWVDFMATCVDLSKMIPYDTWTQICKKSY